MNENKPTPDSVKQAMQEMRERSRDRTRRLKLTADLLVFMSLLAFLGLSLLAARASWEALHLPWWLLIPFAGLAFTLQRLLGLTVRRGRLQRAPRASWRWLGLALLCLASIVWLGTTGSP